MGLDFDAYAYLRNLRTTKPPYQCPVESCDKAYKSIVGIQYHLFNFDHQNPQPEPEAPKTPAVSTPTMNSSRKKSTKSRSSTHNKQPQEKHTSPVPEGLTYAEAQRMVEFDIGNGRSQRLSIFEPIEVVSMENYQAMVPPGGSLDDILAPVEPGKRTQYQPETAEPFTPIRGVPSIPISKLPEPSFRILEDYKIPDAAPLPNSYIRFIEKSPDELDAEVEYDADEEDGAWLALMNEKRKTEGLASVSEEQFELLMDRLEKESYFQMSTAGHEAALIDDDAVCCICMDGECQNSNVILFCDMCNLAVHQDCYGVPYIPEGQWLCRRCLQSPSRAVECVLCPNQGGAFKQTDRGTWAHVVCALWIPEVRFANTVFLEPIDSIETIPPARWKLTCYICKQKGVGACIQCHKSNCYAAFHVTCAQQAGLHMKMDTVRDNGATTGEPSVLVQKLAFCDTHTPADAETRPRVNRKEKTFDFKDDAKEKMKQARKLLAKKRSSVPIISIPTIPPEKIQEIASLISVPRRNQFIQRLIAYWTLKRQYRNGVPLLRRLQTSNSSHHSRKGETQSAPEQEVSTRKSTKKTSMKKDIENQHVNLQQRTLLEQLKYWQSLRQDLERARLLCELVRKREKMKKEFVKVYEQCVMLELRPMTHFLGKVLDQLISKDQGEIFAEPVDISEVPDYTTVVTNPMDFSTMKQKLNDQEYHDLDDLETDFNLMLSNCMAYNSKDTVFYRAAVKMRDLGGAIIRQARRDVSEIGFDSKTGLLLPEKPSTRGKGVTDEQTAAEFDQFMLDESRKALPLSEQLTKLLNIMDIAQSLKHGMTRAKRVKTVKNEIASVRRKIAMEQSGTPARRKSTTKSQTSKKGDDSDDQTDDSQDAASSNSSSSSGSSDEDADEDDADEESPGYKTRRKEKIEKTTRPTRNLRNKTPPATPKRRESTASVGAADKRVPRKRSPSKRQEEAPTSPKRRVSQDVGKDTSKDASKETTSEGPHVTPAKKAATISPLPSTSPQTGSPSGVNRRTAVLFTRKAAAAAFRKPEAPQTTTKRRVGRPRKNLDSALGVNSSGNSSSGKSSGDGDAILETKSVPSSESFRVYRSGGAEIPAGSDESENESERSSSAVDDSSSSSDDGSSQQGDSDSEDSQSSNDDASNEKDAASDDSSDDEALSRGDGTLEPLDLVWAKCRGYPWYPALIIDPDMPNSGIVHKGVPIPAPPTDVLALAANYTEPVYLVLFFDTKRTWQWLPRSKIDQFVGKADLDQEKLFESKKPAERKAVRKAYQEAILYKHQITGQLQKNLEQHKKSDKDADDASHSDSMAEDD
ncbi:bromodomain-containing protein 1 isoform X3 [Neocloeon triangulifer]|uniref:bromodomain-containing protein 1 isoform X3 n=1 Tax=Neocloeon triangulifer TaxID=2078957 RepID=UPI00286F3A50|nr:bromodomain-containing protein 1 isoform X3 [Neocloeon triangulifer]